MGLTSKKEIYSSQDCKLTEGQLKVFYTYRVFKNILLNKDSGMWVFLGFIELVLKVPKEPGSSVFPPRSCLGYWCGIWDYHLLVTTLLLHFWASCEETAVSEPKIEGVVCFLSLLSVHEQVKRSGNFPRDFFQAHWSHSDPA